MEKKLGVLGGMGPFATSVFFERMIERTNATKDQEHIDMIILNHATLPDRTEAIITERPDAFLRSIEKDIKLLDVAGVSNIVIPCNTSHYFFSDMQAMTSIHIINMVDKTIDFIKEKYGHEGKVGILATDGTILSGVYERACEKKGIDSLIPDSKTQKQVMSIIYKIKSNLHVHAPELNTIIHKLITEQNCTTVILGCTELSCVPIDARVANHCVDPMNILVEAAIHASGKDIN